MDHIVKSREEITKAIGRLSNVLFDVQQHKDLKSCIQVSMVISALLWARGDEQTNGFSELLTQLDDIDQTVQ